MGELSLFTFPEDLIFLSMFELVGIKSKWIPSTSLVYGPTDMFVELPASPYSYKELSTSSHIYIVGDSPKMITVFALLQVIRTAFPGLFNSSSKSSATTHHIWIELSASPYSYKELSTSSHIYIVEDFPNMITVFALFQVIRTAFPGLLNSSSKSSATTHHMGIELSASPYSYKELSTSSHTYIMGDSPNMITVFALFQVIRTASSGLLNSSSKSSAATHHIWIQLSLRAQFADGKARTPAERSEKNIPELRPEDKGVSILLASHEESSNEKTISDFRGRQR